MCEFKLEEVKAIVEADLEYYQAEKELVLMNDSNANIDEMNTIAAKLVLKVEKLLESENKEAQSYGRLMKTVLKNEGIFL